ncbi:MATE family efflux transporter [Cuneatibacter caecimuris]|uniref:Putative MATE family efflux protein n=1 Tax=Cuneatibacter caecimuris TaxID=1796618 RepID=A0A4Q7PP63_9FIRM|nr:MATE family efflux transporter [Cuneatibacter caecimuris]RZT02694.1 putative MATE family efflux protein [Cuneatibacter caecimuris]
MAKSTARDMTAGSPLKLILSFMIPLTLGNLFQQFYSLADTIIVGRFLGVDALAAVGSTGAVNFLVMGFVIGLCNGFAIPIAQRFGARDIKDLRRYAGNAVWLAIFFSAVLTLVTVIFARPFLVMTQTPEDIIDGAYRYIVVIFAGIPFLFLYNLLSAVMRALGDSKTPLYFLLLAAGMNIVLDLIFIAGIGTGEEGAAWATVISQGLSGILCLFVIYRQFDVLKLEKDDMKLRGFHMRILCNAGIPMGLQFSITAIGSVILQTAVNMLGSSVVAAVTAGSKVSQFFCQPHESLGSTMATYSGQNLGAGRLDRISEGVKKGTAVCLAYSVIAFVLMATVGPMISLLFLDSGETAIIEMVRQFLFWNGMFYFALGILCVLRFTIQGVGYSGLAMFAGVAEMIARSLVAFAFVGIFQYDAICFANPVAWVFAIAFLIPAYVNVMKKLAVRFGRSSS